MTKQHWLLIAVVAFYAAIGPVVAVYFDKLDIEHGLAASAALASFSGTVWIAAGVWLSHADIASLNNLPTKSPKFVLAPGIRTP